MEQKYDNLNALQFIVVILIGIFVGIGSKSVSFAFAAFLAMFLLVQPFGAYDDEGEQK